MPETLCANPRFPDCKHPRSAHRFATSAQNGGHCKWECGCLEFVAPADTVSVTVQVPRPPEGWRWYNRPIIVRDPGNNRTLATIEMRPVQPEPLLVPVMLTREDRAFWATCFTGEPAGDGPTANLIRACRDADAEDFVAAARPPVCGAHMGTIENGERSWTFQCLQPPGHVGAHSPEKP